MTKKLLINIAQIATPLGKAMKKGKEMSQIWVIQNGAIFIEEGVIRKVGPSEQVVQELGGDLSQIECEIEDLSGKTVVPGFVDSHTHFVFGGYRVEEFCDRLEGKEYLDILKEGGGIQSTVKATREASFRGLYESGKSRMDEMLQQGVTTLEGKSGYGLDKETELKQLRVMKELNRQHPVDLAVTFMGAHAVPSEYKGREDEFIQWIITDVLPSVKGEELAEFCDIFCEKGVFTVAQSRTLLSAAKEMGFAAKIHADEIEAVGGSELAAELEALSADHLLRIPQGAIEKLAAGSVVATLLPCTAFSLAKPYAPARKLIDSGCAVALATDYNPGSCFTGSIPLLLSLAGIHMQMTLPEVLTAITLNGAAAVGRSEKIGSVEVGKQADLTVLSYPDYRYLVYHTGMNIVESVLKNGKTVYQKKRCL